ncbi:hypothetical protein QBC47DRAFT_437460 [Echria macrotheca]|uniref:Uncharacterized protein n=1 Tax=Echria macrotheca TaxID=438768 RepID=A0AAJ0BJS5_9PEZI|nr:hypothetical protein QBC47DRAFT_437460 [Echria macrotheca]
MSCRQSPLPEFRLPGGRGEAKAPVVNGFYYDGLRDSDNHEEYKGPPPPLNIEVRNKHGSWVRIFRAACPPPMEALLCHIARIVSLHRLTVENMAATTYNIQITLSQNLTEQEFHYIAYKMASGVVGQIAP